MLLLDNSSASQGTTEDKCPNLKKKHSLINLEVEYWVMKFRADIKRESMLISMMFYIQPTLSLNLAADHKLNIETISILAIYLEQALTCQTNTKGSLLIRVNHCLKHRRAKSKQVWMFQISTPK